MAALTIPFKASGTTLGYKLTSGDTSYTQLGQLTGFDFGGIQIAPIDTTVLASAYKTSIPSIPEYGEVTFTSIYVPADPSVATLTAQAGTPTVLLWQLMTPDGSSSTTGSTASFSGYLTNFAPAGFTVDNTPTASVTVKITGPVTFTTGT